MAEEEADPESSARINQMVEAIITATQGRSIGEVQMAYANAAARMALATDKPDVVILTTLEILSEVYRGYREKYLETKPAPTTN